MRKFLVVVVVAWLLGFGNVMAQMTYYSRVPMGNWNSLTTWSNVSHTGAAVIALPGAMDNVVIGNGSVVTLDVNATVRDVTVNSGILRYDNVLSSKRLEIIGNLRIESAGEFTVNTVGAQLQNELILRGNVVVNGRWKMRPVPASSSYCVRVIFATPNPQTITGTPVEPVLMYRVSVNKSSKANTVNCSVPMDISTGTESGTEAFNFNDVNYNVIGIAPVGGTWQQSASTLSLHQNTINSRFQSIEEQGALHIIGTANILFGQTGGATFTLAGGDIIFDTDSNMPSRFGISAGNSFEYQDGTSSISSFTLRKGTIIIASRFSRSLTNSALSFNQSGGTLIVGAIPNHTSGNRASFEVSSALSSFAMSDGTIIIRNQNISASASRPADFWLNSNSTISGGTIQFGDAQSSPNQVFSINVPSNVLLQNLTVSSAARLHPFTPAQNLRLAANFTVNGTFDGTQTHPSNSMPAASTLTMQGINSSNQAISGFGIISLFNLTMNRQGTGTGVVQVQKGLTLAGVLNLQEIISPSQQILELGSGVDFTITNSAASAVQGMVLNYMQNPAELRSVRTSNVSGRLYRALAGTNEYTYPLSSLGSGMNPAPTYTPLTYYAASASGRLGAKVAVGENQTLLGAHKQAPSSITSYARRVWSLATGGIGGTGRLAAIIPSDAFGSLAVMRFARYLPNENTPGNEWLYTDTLTSRSAIEFEGDWTWLEAALRVFYSRASGAWSDAASWSFVSHRGEAVPSGVFPSRAADSAVIGGGVNGANNHVIALQSPVTIGGAAVGTGTANTGTLECTDEAWLGGKTFILGERSTLRIGAARGITAVPANTGNIRTTALRLFQSNAQYEYIGTKDQEFGEGLPDKVFALGVAKPVLTTLLGNRNIDIWQNLSIASGILDAQAFTFRNETTATAGAFLLGANGILRIGGTRGFADASTGTVSKYGTYSMDERSTVEFYGTQHVVEAVPTGAGYGNVSLRGAASVSVWNPVLMRGSLFVRDNVRFVNYSRDVRVLGSVYNNASMVNNGVLDIGQ
jgi:hypothetical protein